MTWVIIAIASYFLTAVSSVVDKHLLNKKIPNPVVYAFYVGLFSIFSLILTPFGFEWLGWTEFFVAISVGVVFMLALIAFFTALKADEASRVIAIVGGLTPLFIVFFSVILFGDILSERELFAFIFLVSGSVLISAKRSKTCGIFEVHKFQCIQSTAYSILSALLFAAFFVLAKFVFDHQAFISGFIWTRIGSFLAALLLLLLPSTRALIFSTTKKVTKKIGGLFVANKTIAGISFLMLNYSISLGNIALVNALEGVKYAFVLIIVFILSRVRPSIILEQTSSFAMIQKWLAIALIFIGLYVLAVL